MNRLALAIGIRLRRAGQAALGDQIARAPVQQRLRWRHRGRRGRRDYAEPTQVTQQCRSGEPDYADLSAAHAAATSGITTQVGIIPRSA